MELSEKLDGHLEDIFEELDTNSICESCKYYHEWYESHPYGNGTAQEHLSECNAARWQQCPRMLNTIEVLLYQQHKKEK